MPSARAIADVPPGTGMSSLAGVWAATADAVITIAIVAHVNVLRITGIIEARR